jgi:hypothetical protein
MEKLTVVLGATLVLLVPSLCALAVVGAGTALNDVEVLDLQKGEDPPPIVTLAEFEQIERSMSYQEVVDIVGDPGVVIVPPTALESDDGDAATSMYLWTNSDASNMKVTLENDQLVTKAQLYLE